MRFVVRNWGGLRALKDEFLGNLTHFIDHFIPGSLVDNGLLHFFSFLLLTFF